MCVSIEIWFYDDMIRHICIYKGIGASPKVFCFVHSQTMFYEKKKKEIETEKSTQSQKLRLR